MSTSLLFTMPQRALSVVAFLLLAPALGAQDTTTVTRSVPAPASAPAPVRKDTTAAPAALPAPVRKDTAAAPAAAAPAPVAKDTTTARALTATPAAAPAPTARVTTPSAAPSTAPAASAAGAPVASPTSIDGIAPSDLANEYVQRAVSLYELGRDEDALAEYRRGIAHDPLDSDTWFGLADLLHEMGRDKQAIETYTLALTTIEHAPELRLPFAELLMANRRKPEAIKVLQRGIELDPDQSADLKAMLGKVVLGVLDDSTTVAAPPAATPATPGVVAAAPAATSTAAPSAVTKTASSAAKPKSRADRKKRKKLCNLFCPGTLDSVAPKP